MFLYIPRHKSTAVLLTGGFEKFKSGNNKRERESQPEKKIKLKECLLPMFTIKKKFVRECKFGNKKKHLYKYQKQPKNNTIIPTKKY